MTSELAIQGAVNGLSVASILLLVALGLAITFGLMNVINMAHGQFIMVGAYVAYVAGLVEKALLGTSAAGHAFLFALPASFLVAAAMGWLLERGLIRFLYKHRIGPGHRRPDAIVRAAIHSGSDAAGARWRRLLPLPHLHRPTGARGDAEPGDGRLSRRTHRAHRRHHLRRRHRPGRTSRRRAVPARSGRPVYRRRLH